MEGSVAEGSSKRRGRDESARVEVPDEWVTMCMIHPMRPVLDMESKEMLEDEGAAIMDVNDVLVDLSALEVQRCGVAMYDQVDSVGLGIGYVKYMLW